VQLVSVQINYAFNFGSDFNPQTYGDILLVADTAENIPWTIGIESLLRCTAFFWATLLFYCRMMEDKRIEAELRQEALARLTNILYVHRERENETRRQGRIMWPTFIAAIETRDPIHRHWFMKGLRACRNHTLECSQLCVMAEEILRLQCTPHSPRVDLADFMKLATDTCTVEVQRAGN
jgi:hypothetical protein